MIAMGGIGLTGFGQHPVLTPAAYAIGGLLVAGGASLFLKKPFAFWIAIVAAVALAISGALGLVHHPELAMPVPPALSLVIGLYLILRTIMARPSLQRPKKE